MTGNHDLAWTGDAADSRDDSATSWYELSPAMSLRMLDPADVRREASLVDVGAGSNRLADALVERGHTDITGLDLSTVALDAANARLGERGPVLRWTDWDFIAGAGRAFRAWHDRAVLHLLPRLRAGTLLGDAPRH